MEAYSFLPLRKKIEELSGIADEERRDIYAIIDRLTEESEDRNFMIKRLQKDKSIAENILNATITDLGNNKAQLESVYQTLRSQHDELVKQKKLTEQKSVRLSQNLKKLKQSYDELEQFSYVASHDLKSPLRTITNFAQLLRRRYKDQLDGEALEYINFINEGAFQMHEVIHALLEYSKVGRQGEVSQPVQLKEVLRFVESNLQADIAENQAVIQYEALPEVYGVGIYLTQLFQNLIGNAIKFRSAATPIIQISYRAISDEAWEIQVTDNGIGLDESYQDKVFFPFQRLDNQKRKGTGIGLSICKKIVEIHNGQIHYKKLQAGGTCFVFTLPTALKGGQ